MNLFYKYKRETMVNIECYYSEPESGFCAETDNKQAADLLTVMIKRKEKRRHDNDIPVICPAIQYYDGKCYDSDVLHFLPKLNNGGYHCCDKGDTVLSLFSSAENIKNTTCQNPVYDRFLCENPADKHPDAHPENVTSAKEPENIAAERSMAENTPESAGTPEAEYTPETENMPAAEMAPVLPEFPVFRLSGVTPEKKSLTLRHYMPEKGSQEKAAQVIGYTGKNQAVPESGRPDYYCSYHFRQKYQPPEPVLIYRGKPGRFKLETGSEPLTRRLKAMNVINGIDGVDIL